MRQPDPPTPRTQCTVTLRFEDQTPEEDGPPPADPALALPRTRVTLVRICEPGGTATQLVGVETGVCQFGSAGDALVRARCWWAGQGSEIEVQRVLRQLVVRRAELHDGELGPMQDAGELALPVGAEVHVLGPETLR